MFLFILLNAELSNNKTAKSVKTQIKEYRHPSLPTPHPHPHALYIIVVIVQYRNHTETVQLFLEHTKNKKV